MSLPYRFLPSAKGSVERILLAGLGGLLILIAAGGIDDLFVFTELQKGNVEIRQRFLARNDSLERIRSGIFLSGIYLRDYLLAPKAERPEAQRNLERAQGETTQALDAYQRALGPSELSPFWSLRGEIHAYWRVIDLVLHWQDDEKLERSYQYFYGELVRRRKAMLDIADRIGQLNERELAAGDARIQESFGSFRVRVILTLIGTLVGAVLLGAVTYSYISRLESESRRNYDRAVQAGAELKDLSAKLVQAQEDERRAVSRELHDEVGQSLSALLVEAGNLSAMVPPDDSELRPRLDSIKRLADNCVHAVRGMSLALRPSMLDDLGLAPALEWQAREVSKRTGVRVQVKATDEAEELPEEYRTCIYRVAQEAVNNAVRHSGAERVQVAVERQNGHIALTVRDDGRGFDPVRTRGLGILGMEERVRHIGGSFHIDSQPGLGAAVRVELPIEGAR